MHVDFLQANLTTVTVARRTSGTIETIRWWGIKSHRLAPQDSLSTLPWQLGHKDIGECFYAWLPWLFFNHWHHVLWLVRTHLWPAVFYLASVWYTSVCISFWRSFVCVCVFVCVRMCVYEYCCVRFNFVCVYSYTFVVSVSARWCWNRQCDPVQCLLWNNRRYPLVSFWWNIFVPNLFNITLFTHTYMYT